MLEIPCTGSIILVLQQLQSRSYLILISNNEEILGNMKMHYSLWVIHFGDLLLVLGCMMLQIRFLYAAFLNENLINKV